MVARRETHEQRARRTRAQRSISPRSFTATLEKNDTHPPPPRNKKKELIVLPNTRLHPTEKAPREERLNGVHDLRELHLRGDDPRRALCVTELVLINAGVDPGRRVSA